MKKIVPVTAFILLAFLSAAASAEPATRAVMPQGVHTIVTNDDYPEEAIRNKEQGNVTFRLDIGSDGMPTGCSVTDSSGSPTLDATTCRILMERARFQPARDANGKPTTDSFSSRVRWVLPDPVSARADAMTQLWSSCVMGEAAKLVTSELTSRRSSGDRFRPAPRWR
jgi:TonB family protein